MCDARNRIVLNEYFSLDEFEDPSTGQVMLNPTLLEALVRARVILGMPIEITSGYRTAEYNRELGGRADSLHLIGAAVDLRTGEHAYNQALVAALRSDARLFVECALDHVHVHVAGLRASDPPQAR
jgi:hypothetical protein